MAETNPANGRSLARSLHVVEPVKTQGRIGSRLLLALSPCGVIDAPPARAPAILLSNRLAAQISWIGTWAGTWNGVPQAGARYC